MKPTSKSTIKKNCKDAKIQKYFKSTPKVLNAEDKQKECEDSRSVYIDMLKAKLKGMADNEPGTKDNESEQEAGAYAILKNEVLEDVHSKATENDYEINVSQNTTKRVRRVQEGDDTDWEEKYKVLKKRYLKLSVDYSELNLKHKDLLKTATRNIQSDTEQSVASSNDIFTINEIKTLRRLPLEQKKDSTFILQCLKYAYKDNPSILRFKSLGGTTDSMTISEEGQVEVLAGKDPLTPEKVQRIKELFIERLSACDIDSVAYGQRIKESKINQLFASGIKNIGKKQ